MANNKHLSLSDRVTIEQLLNARYSFKAIGRELDKDCTTVAKEVKNHELIRRVIPKGTSLDNLTQEKVNLMMNHINSYSRKKLGDFTPYEIFEKFHGRKILEKLEQNSFPQMRLYYSHLF